MNCSFDDEAVAFLTLLFKSLSISTSTSTSVSTNVLTRCLRVLTVFTDCLLLYTFM